MANSNKERIDELLQVNNRLVEKGRTLKRRLEQDRDQFAFYGKEHREKAAHARTSDVAEASLKKAIVNETFAKAIQKVLDEYHSS